ncbi:class II aldolase/adducin family protein [Thauera linaloolentis]|uniref:Class II aldolase/adducin family protein n=1 Tax=Thauera linaloolentis (strain DSM 12138 / JCM 21573 / CCUG 41526 / CIP 105981 / IAM 15112 / NBRC 102519 / 47Lol) TaxID=1123367 RepID=N6Y8I8_THAL4|nr:class II aldolase/adducin family protein [Thauera linaloolentis]ENO90616.1 class II aldolase/adducin family protein [Thauera linaloolentis 47Lol = DSM 12138]MCM8566122.1 class II aldolase/adducin family protein [Thauera linaloolentis]
MNPKSVHPPAHPADHPELRIALLGTMHAMGAARLNVGTAGNASVRLPAAAGMLITPSGLAAEHCRPEDMAVVAADGGWRGPAAPSSEWQLHRDIYSAFAEAGAVLHAHAPFATALACQRLGIPPFHYMIARFGGSTVPCARYATFGSQALSDAALAALQGRNACLLANHGMVVFGRDLAHALALAIELETLCEQYWRTLQIGTPVLLSEREMAEVIERFRWYGKPRT